MDYDDQSTEDLIALRNALTGWDVPFDGYRQRFIEDIERRQECAQRHMQPERFGVVF